MRRIFWIKMNLLFGGADNDDADDDDQNENDDDLCNLVVMENDYVDQFRYTQHIVMRGFIRDDMAIFIISHCLCLLSMDISDSIGNSSSDSEITDHTLQSIAEHCTRLQSLSLNRCTKVTDTGLITISLHCHELKSLAVVESVDPSSNSHISPSTSSSSQYLSLLLVVRQHLFMNENTSLYLRVCPPSRGDDDGMMSSPSWE